MYIVLVCYRFSSGDLKIREASNIQSGLYLSLPLPPQPPSPLSPATIHSTLRTVRICILVVLHDSPPTAPRPNDGIL